MKSCDGWVWLGDKAGSYGGCGLCLDRLAGGLSDGTSLQDLPDRLVQVRKGRRL